MAKLPFMIRNDDKVVVFRPENPHLAISVASQLVGAVERGEQTPEQNSEAFKAILYMQPYRYVGLAAIPQNNDPKLLDEKGWVIGKMQPGDSFGPWKQIADIRASGVEFKIGDELPRAPADA